MGVFQLNIRLLLLILNAVIINGLQLSPEYSVTWESTENNITFEVVVATKGFVGFGLSPTGGMAGADIIVGGVHNNGTPYFGDYHAIGPQTPILDNSQDWHLLVAYENSTHTLLKFWRELDTCDDQDWPITLDTQKLIWSYGLSDNLQYHGALNRGTKMRNILDPPMEVPDLSQYKVWDIVNTAKVPPSPTTYWCTIHRTPNFTAPHHMVGFDVHLPNEQASRHTHHIDVYRCRGPTDVPASSIFDKWIGDEGKDCYTPDPNKPDFPSNYCDIIELGWAIGGEITLFPEHTGLPFESNAYYMLEIHYDNPESLADVEYETGYHVYYTDRLREHDAGLFLVGAITSYTQMIPPDSVGFTTVAQCSSWCTENFPQDGLNVFAFLFHAHTSATSMKVRLFRNGVEEPWPIHDAFYDFNYQQNRLLRHEFKLFPGDHISMECTYDSRWKSGKATIGGRSTSEEMCFGNFYYYPNYPGIVNCNSEFPAAGLLSFLGVDEVSIEGTWQEDPTVLSPPKYANWTLTQVVESLDWTEERRTTYQNMNRYSPHDVECFPLKGEQRGKAGYPSVPEWIPEESCKRTN